MSNEEKRNLTGQNVHGVEEGVNWNSWNSWDKKSTKKEEPKVPEPKPVAEEPTPAPEPAPAKGEDWVSGNVLQSMANHLRKTKRLQITIDEAKELILNDEETKAVYKNHQNRGKF